MLKTSSSLLDFALNVTKHSFIPFLKRGRESIQPTFEIREIVWIILASPDRLDMILTLWMTSPSPFEFERIREKTRSGRGIQG